MSLQSFNPKIKEATNIIPIKNLSARLTVCIKVSLTDLSTDKSHCSDRSINRKARMNCHNRRIILYLTNNQIPCKAIKTRIASHRSAE